MTQAVKQKKGWGDFKHLMIIFGCMLIQAIPYGLAQNVPPLFVRYLHTDFNFSLANIGLIITIGAIAASFVSPVGGKFYSKYSTRLVMIIALLISCFGLFMNAYVNTLGMYLLANAIVQIGSVVYSGLGVPYLIGLWFGDEHKAQALGIAFAGGSIGNFFLQPIFTHLLHKYAVNSVSGLHFVYFIAACSALIVGLVILLFFIRDYKGDNNQDTTKTKEDLEKETKEVNAKLKGIGTKAVQKLPSFWILATGMLFIGANISAQSFQYANYFEHLKFDSTLVGLVGSTFAIACLIGNTCGGWLYAKLGIFHSVLIAFGLQLFSCLAMISLQYVHLDVLPYTWGALYGLSVFIYMSGPAILVQNLFGMKESSETLGIFSIFFAVGFALGNIFYGIVADTFGYLPAWLLTLAFLVIGFVTLSIMVRKIEKHDYAHVQTNPEK